MGIIGIAGGPQAFSSASGGKVLGYNAISTVFQTVANANTSRTRIIFHNPGTVDILIGPGSVVNLAGVGSTFAPSVAAYGGCFRVFANGGTLEITGECQTSWQAAAVSGTGILTVMDSNVG